VPSLPGDASKVVVEHPPPERMHAR
jgi:hypothetical protein